MAQFIQNSGWVVLLLIAGMIRHAAADEQPPDFLVDHAGCVVDQTSFDAIASSAFLRDSFAHSRPGGAKTDTGASWTNFTILGELTYLEFLSHDAMKDLGVTYGECFVALHSTKEGGVEWVAEQMESIHPESNPRVRLRHFVKEKEQIPWSYNLTFSYAAGAGKFDVWIKELHPQFKYRMAPGSYPAAGNIDRTRDAPIVAFHPDKLLKDVTSFTLAVSYERRRQIEGLFEVIGFERQLDGDGSSWASKDATYTFVSQPGSRNFALKMIGLQLTRPVGNKRIEQFGQLLTLHLGAGSQGRLEIGINGSTIADRPD